MKAKILIISFAIFSLTCVNTVKAQMPFLEVIQAGIKKVIVAVDLKVQRMQNETIWLQNAQKLLENAMSKLRLEEIADWAEKQQTMFANYYEELRQVKAILVYYSRVKDILSQQKQILAEYRQAWTIFKGDKNFTSQELEQMLGVYTGIIAETGRSVDNLSLVINSFLTQMDDAARLEIIDGIGNDVQRILSDLREFNNQNKMLSWQRTYEVGENEFSKRIYGLR